MSALTVGVYAAMFLLVSSLTGNIHGYLDPGTGSIMLQTLLAAAVGALAVCRIYWRRLKSFVMRRDTKRESLPKD